MEAKLARLVYRMLRYRVKHVEQRALDCMAIFEAWLGGQAVVTPEIVLRGAAFCSRACYSRDFIPSMPADTTLQMVSRTIGENEMVDEMIFSFTHTREIIWMLPDVSPTNRRVEVPLVAIVCFRDGKIAHERIYWDQGSVLKQLGLLTE